jgi:hypothetical protein
MDIKCYLLWVLAKTSKTAASVGISWLDGPSQPLFLGHLGPFQRQSPLAYLVLVRFSGSEPGWDAPCWLRKEALLGRMAVKNWVVCVPTKGPVSHEDQQELKSSLQLICQATHPCGISHQKGYPVYCIQRFQRGWWGPKCFMDSIQGRVEVWTGGTEWTCARPPVRQWIPADLLGFPV